MKKISVIFFVLAIMDCVVMFGGPVLPLSNVAVVKIGETFKVIYKGHSQGPVKLSILDSDGELVFQEKILCERGFIRPYNFARLPKGNYQIRITDPSGEHLEEIYYEDEWKNKTPQTKSWVARISKLKCDGNKYMLIIPGQSQKEFVINIYDQNEQLVFSEEQKIENDFAKVYNLKNLNGATIRLLSQFGEEMLVKTLE
jgi:hypothetical protein